MVFNAGTVNVFDTCWKNISSPIYFFDFIDIFSSEKTLNYQKPFYFK